MLRGSSLIISFLLLVGRLSIFAQQDPNVQVGSVKLYRIGELLRMHNVELTEPALLRALKNSDAEVRALAAEKLAEDKTRDAIPAIEEALAAEKMPRSRVNIALALAQLADQTGLTELRRLCADSDFVPEFRLYAATYMFDLHSQTDECLGAVEEIVRSKTVSFGDRISALSLLPRFHDLAPEESQRLFQLVVDRLDDPEPTVRMGASAALVSLGNAAAIPFLKTAIAREKEEGIRNVFERDLGKLQGHPTE
ncbi:MAG: HEAT repeat domain-containing protein [Terriglobales bacterium]